MTTTRKLALLATGTVALAAVAAGFMAGCTGANANNTIFNPNFLSSVDPNIRALPGNASGLVLVTLLNRSNELLEPIIAFGSPNAADPENQVRFSLGVLPGEKLGTFIDCSKFNQLTLGSLVDLRAPAGNVVQGPDFSIGNFRSALRAYGSVLVKGRDFDCGSNVVFVFAPSQEAGATVATAVVYQLTD